MDYTLTATNITDTSFDVVITANVTTTGTRILALKVEDTSAPGTGTNFMLSDTGMAQGGTKTFPVENGSGITINSGTEYGLSLEVEGTAVATPITVTTKSTGYDTPRTATQEQWEDLASRVKAKADSSDVPTITMTSTDPGEGQPLAENNFIAVYSNIGSLLNMFYPVGSYYETSDTTFDPNVSWGGTWVEDSAGRVTVSQDTNDTSFDVVGETGGSKELQSHYHSAGTYDGYTIRNDSAASGSGVNAISVNSASTVSSTRISTNVTGTGDSGNLQPYVVVKRWHRTA